MSYSPDQPRDQTGKWSSAGAAAGDHQAEQPRDASMRRVPGHGTLPRSKPIAMHNHAPSVGTGGGGGGGEGPRLSAAARDRIIRGKLVDQRHFGQYPTDAAPLRQAQARLASKLLDRAMQTTMNAKR